MRGFHVGNILNRVVQFPKFVAQGAILRLEPVYGLGVLNRDRLKLAHEVFEISKLRFDTRYAFGGGIHRRIIAFIAVETTGCALKTGKLLAKPYVPAGCAGKSPCFNKEADPWYSRVL